MKMPIKNFFPILIAALGLFFAVFVYFTGILGSGHGIYTDIGSVMTESTEEDVTSDVLNPESAANVEVPAIKYIGKARTVGEAIDFRELFQFTYQSGQTVNGTDESHVTMYLLDIKDRAGNSVCEKLSAEDIEAMEEITSPFLYDQESKTLYFHKSGSYTVTIKVYYDGNTYVEYEFVMPVEVQVG